MKERRILFSGPTVRAILGGRKTQSRWIVKPQPHDFIHAFSFELHPFAPSTLSGTPAEGVTIAPERKVWVMEDWCRNVVGVLGDCPYGQPGDRLWARWTLGPCDGGITIEITGVRVERLQDITEEDVPREGVDPITKGCIYCHSPAAKHLHTHIHRDRREKFACLWQSIHGPGSWDANPWVWVVEFRRVEDGR